MNILKIILFTLLVCMAGSAKAQEWINPSEKYTDAYKQYLDAACPVQESSIKHFVFFARDREEIIDHSLLTHPMFSGAQIMYTWRELEPRKGEYDFSKIEEDYEYLRSYGKKLFVQLQDATFNPAFRAVPEYLMTDEFDGGAVPQYNDEGETEGWVAKRWNEKVRQQFEFFLMAFGKEFDGKIEGINLQETAIGVNSETDSSFSNQKYLEGVKANMLALKKAFPQSTTMIYANFMPGEWLPWEDEGYLKEIYRYGEEISVGLGGPDLMVTRKGQLNHTIAQMHEGEFTAPLGIAIQDGNYIGKTGADADFNESSDSENRDHNNIVPLLHAFAKDFMKVNYMFWVNQEPYFEKDVLSCFATD